jgi:hypothetical protein
LHCTISLSQKKKGNVGWAKQKILCRTKKKQAKPKKCEAKIKKQYTSHSVSKVVLDQFNEGYGFQSRAKKKTN